jgi:N-carbamoyl-L-amino-acid hydrolase
VFIPCRQARSHAPDEWAENDDITLGTAVLLEAVRELDRKLQETDHGTNSR